MIIYTADEVQIQICQFYEELLTDVGIWMANYGVSDLI